MTRYARQCLSGWGKYPREDVKAFRPESLSELTRTVTEGDVHSLIPRGLGRSYGDAALNVGEGVVRCERLNRFLSWDPDHGTLECEAGASFEDILRVFLPRGFFPSVTPGTKHVTIGGAIAADVHGKNHHRDGSFANCVDSFRLITAKVGAITCSRSENSELFWATFGGLGLTGILQSVRLRLMPVETAYVAADYRKAANLDAALDLFSHDDEHRYSVAWIDCLATGSSLGRSVLIRGDHARFEELPAELQAEPLALQQRWQRSVPCDLPGFALNPLSVKLFNECYYRRQHDGRSLVDHGSFFYPLDSVSNWNRIYGRRGFLQYQLVLPMETSRHGLVEVLERLSKSRLPSFLAVLKLFGPASEGLLSFPRPGATLALDLPNRGDRLLDLLNTLDEIVLRHGGRVYLAKDARLSPTAFRAMYPRAAEFEAIKRRVDPDGRFASSLSRRLGLCSGPSASHRGVATTTEEHVLCGV